MQLRVSREKYQEEVRAFGLPEELKGMLIALICATLHDRFTPRATSILVTLAKEHLKDGIQIGDREYDVVVLEPHDKSGGRWSFQLVRRWYGGTIRRLEEL